MQRFAPALLTLLFLGGCHEIYSQFCNSKKERLHCLRTDDALSSNILQKEFSVYIDDACPYLFTVQSYNFV